MKKWFKDETGYMIKEPHVKSFLYDTRSQKYFESLENYNISFRKSYSIHNNGIINVVAKNQLLSILHIHGALRSQFKKGKVLYRHPEDVLEHVVDSFKLPIYEILLVPLSVEDMAQKNSCLDSLDKILKQRSYKKAIILSNDTIIEKDGDEAKIENKKMHFGEFSKGFQDMILSKTLIFQGENIPLLKFIDNTNDSITSIIDEETMVKLMKEEEIIIGKPVRGLDELEHFYITRTFTSEGKIFSEEYFHRTSLESTVKFIIIADRAGMGKTTVLTRLGSLIKKQFPQHYLIRIDLNMYTSLLRKYTAADKEPISLERFVQSDDEHLLNKTSKRRNIAKIFVTTRSHQKKDLEIKLGVESFELKPYSTPAQVTFLTKFWKSVLNLDSDEKEMRCEMYAKELLNKMKRAIGPEFLDLVGIPLQTMMIGDIFQSSNKKMDWLGCQDFLNAESYEENVNDKGNAKGNVAAEGALSEQFENAILGHQKLAAELLLDEKYCHLLKVMRYPSISKVSIIKMGIIQQTGEQLSFIHQTFAEYFLAKCLWNQLKETQEKDGFLHFLVEEIFVSHGYDVVRSFFNDILFEEWNNISEDTFVLFGEVVESITWDRSKNFVRLAGEDRLHILKLILTKSDSKSQEENPLRIMVAGGKTVLHEVCTTKNLEFLQFLVERGADVNAGQ
ncbi:hypothetical protein JTB14_018135 [Gonioctena quinquepunctata]|nr:hypothetical protein JTB14_018135 [Gonioctena quinquepunctata]